MCEVRGFNGSWCGKLCRKGFVLFSSPFCVFDHMAKINLNFLRVFQKVHRFVYYRHPFWKIYRLVSSPAFKTWSLIALDMFALSVLFQLVVCATILNSSHWKIIAIFYRLFFSYRFLLLLGLLSPSRFFLNAFSS